MNNLVKINSAMRQQAPVYSIARSTEQDLYEYLMCFSYTRGEPWFTVYRNDDIVAFVLFNIYNKHTMEISAIEVVEEGCGVGSATIELLFKEFNVRKITGYMVRSSLYFWKRIGALAESKCDLPNNSEDWDMNYPYWDGYFELTIDNFGGYYYGN